MPDNFLRSDFMGASLLGVLGVWFCGTGEDSLLAAEVRARALIGSSVRDEARLLGVFAVCCFGTREASDVDFWCVGRLGFTESYETSSSVFGREMIGCKQKAPDRWSLAWLVVVACLLGGGRC